MSLTASTGRGDIGISEPLNMPLSAEMGLLLVCLGNESQPGKLVSNHSIDDGVWNAAFALSLRHGITPLFYQRIHDRPSEIVPPATILQQMREVYLSSSAVAMRQGEQISQCLGALCDGEIPVIPLKGTYTAQQVYGNPALRPMGDLDLLVPYINLKQAYNIFLELGCHPKWSFDPDGDFSSTHHLPPLVKGGKSAVEIHWTLVEPQYPFQVDIERIWQQARRGTLAGQAVLVLPPEELLLHTCIHGAYQDRFSGGLKFICDVDQIVRHYRRGAREPINWVRFIDLACLWRARNCAFLTLQVAQKLLTSPVPMDLLISLQPSDYDSQLTGWALAKILDKKEYSSNLAEFYAEPSWRNRAALFIDRVFLPRDRMLRDYPQLASKNSLVPVYIAHLGKVLQRQIPAAWRLVRGHPDSLEAAAQEEQIGQLQSWMASG